MLTCVILIVISDRGTAALAGLALVYVTQMLNTLNWGVRQVSETEVRFNAVERLLQYQGENFQEAARLCDGDPKEGEWPAEGKIELKSYCMRYRPNLPLV